MNKIDIINSLGLQPLPEEGGYYKEIYKANEKIDNRRICSTIYYLETSQSYSKMHVLDHDEVYYYHDGSPLEMLLVYIDHSEIIKLGKDVLNNEQPQYTVPKGVYQGSHLLNDTYDYSLVSTSSSPAYTNEGFKLGAYNELKDRCLDKLDLLKLLTKC